MNDKLKLLVQYLGEERVKQNEDLSFHTFSKLGGIAEAFYIATSQKELLLALNAADDLDIPFLIIGAGTKIVLSKNTVKGLVIKNRSSFLKIGGIKGKVGREGVGIEEAFVEMESGVSMNKLNTFLKEQKLKEVNGLVSSHATIGGSLLFDPTLRDITHKVKVWEKGFVDDLDILKLKRNHVIVSVILKVKASGGV